MKRNWMQKLVCLGLSLVLLLGNLPVGAFAEDAEMPGATEVTEATEATEVTEVTEASEPEEETTEPEATEAVPTPGDATEPEETDATEAENEAPEFLAVSEEIESMETEDSLWNGRSVVFVGDSITAGTGTTKIYYEFLEEALGFGSVTAMGVGGSCISAASDYGQSNQPLINRYQDIPSADLIVIFMGTNDYGHETPLGSEADAQDRTFFGALNTIVPALVKRHTSSKIVFVTPLHRYGFGTSGILGTQFTYDSNPNGMGAALGDYVAALKTVCAKNSVSVIDLHTECTLDPADSAVQSTYIPDGLHPNAAGHQVIAGIMEDHIRSFSPAEKVPETETESEEQTELVYGNKFASGFTQQNRASSRLNQYLKAGTVITLKNPAVFQWACARTNGEISSTNLGYFPDAQWTDKETAVVESDGWVGFTFKYRDETQSFDLSRPLSDYITIEQPHSHAYKNGICTACGAEHPNLVNYKGKVISILGDSISTFAGYIPTADGFNLEHLARYPQDNLLTDVNETWWMQVVKGLDAKLGINDSWRGATVSGGAPVTSGTTGENAAMSNLQRIKNLGANGYPDVILFYGGTNDLAHVSKVGSFDSDTAPTAVDLTTAKWDNLADGYVHTLLRLKHYYPDTQIIALLPTYTASYYSNAKLAQGNTVLTAICEHYDVAYTDLRDCGISVKDLPDGIHPDAAGMDYISNTVLDRLLTDCEMTAGENTVYSVTHHLTGAESSLGYYKGISHGKSFVTAITGEDLQVTVTMGGTDITASVYASGMVTIPSVTGDVVITAAGRIKPIYEDHLLQLPQPYYGVDLWKVLEHDPQYFYVDKWTVHSSGNVYSVTVPVVPGEKIQASSFGASGANGASMNGIRITWFDENGLLKSVGPDEVYKAFAEKGYLTVPEKAVAVNIPMWTNASKWELYIWPSDYEPGFSLGDHLQRLPEEFCSAVNLWTELTPENKYYTSTGWGNLANGRVWSITIPVVSGERVYANSFKKYGENGNTSSNNSGIRVTWFDENGILKAMSADQTYQEFTENGGWLVAPEGATAVNIPMWTQSDSNEVYLLDREHICGDWEITKEATATAEGQEQQTCAACGHVRPRKLIPVALTASMEPAKVTAGAKPGDVKIDLSARMSIGGDGVADLELDYTITDEAGKEYSLEEALNTPGKYTITPKIKTP